MATETHSETEQPTGSIQARVAVAIGAVLTLVGVAGFFVGDVLLIFGINDLHNVVHLATGLAGVGLGLAAAGRYAGDYNRYLGAIYVLVFVLGVALPGLMGALLNVNMADNLLHLALGLTLGGVAYFAAD